LSSPRPEGESTRELLVERGEGQPLRLQQKYAVRVQQLVKSFGLVQAVRKASFDVFVGEIFGLLGPNGAGKTTTLEIVEGLQRADEGAVQVLGYDSEHERRFIEPRIGIQLQSASLNPRLSALELLRMYAAFYPQPRDPAELLELFGLQEKADSLASTLSGGQQQRLSVALALVGNPDLLLLDEPTTGLDPHARRELWVALQGLQARGKTILLTTHYLIWTRPSRSATGWPSWTAESS
jgi:ABC-2 type transport system ATP-binding protein